MKNAKTNLIHHDETGQAISNFEIISIKECYFNITKHTLNVHGSRKLLATNSFNSQQGEDFIKFTDPVFTLSEMGTLILRKNGYEQIFTIPESKQIILPNDFSYDSGEIHIIMVTNKGKYMEAKFYTEGCSLRQRVNCIMCLTFLKNLNLMPSYISYSIITVLIILASLIIIYI